MLSTLSSRFSNVPRAVGLVWTSAKWWTLAWAILLIVQGILPALTILLTRQLVDSFVTAVGGSGSWERLQPAVVTACLMGGTLVLIEVLNNVVEWVRTAQAQYVQDHVQALIHEKASTVDLAFFETPEQFDRLQRVHREASRWPMLFLEGMGSLFQNAITLLGMGAILLPYGMWLPAALILSTLPALYIVVHFNGRYHHWWERTTADWRRTDYYDSILTHSDFAIELRLLNLGPHFRAAYQSLRKRLRTEGLTLVRQRVRWQLSAGVLGLLFSGGALAWIGWRALQGAATLGDVAMFYQAFQRGQTLMRTLLRNVGDIHSSSLYIGNIFEFLALETRIADPAEPVAFPAPLRQGIEFRHVTFRYPGNEKPTLTDFNLTLPASQIVAIVGPNGAAKSTLTKLLCRLYDLEAGSITVDGVDIRSFPLRDLRRHVTVLVQKFVPYQATATENIAYGDLETVPLDHTIEAAARAAGAQEIIDRLPLGYDTVLGKWFEGGTELSGGEWQRVALARAFFRDAPIVILDEPTSAMDSWAEAKWLARFRDLVRGQTAIVITHRFTTAMQADIIHVMDEGRIVESGTHAELVAFDGLYARSWRAQLRSESAAELTPSVLR